MNINFCNDWEFISRDIVAKIRRSKLIDSIKNVLRQLLNYSVRYDSMLAPVLLYIYRLVLKEYRDLWVVPFQWMDQSADHKKWLLHMGGNAITYGPHFYNDIQSFKTVRLPDVNCHSFINARISMSSSSVVLNDNKALIERTVIPSQGKCDYKAGHIVLHGTKTAIVRLGDAAAIEKGIFLGGNGSSNYYHWLIEILPKLQFLDDLPKQFINYPILVSEDIDQIPALKATMNLIALDHELIILKNNLAYSVGNLIYIDSPSNLPFNLRRGEKFDVAYSVISGHSVAYIKDIALANVKTCLAYSNHPKKIFFSRRSERRKYNKKEVLDCLTKLGFEEVFMEDISFEEQVSLMQNADLIVGPTGAAWTNLMFCRPGTKGLCWMAEEFGDFSAFSTIAHLVGVDLKYVTYKAGVHSTSELFEKEYVVDVALIEQCLMDLI